MATVIGYTKAKIDEMLSELGGSGSSSFLSQISTLALPTSPVEGTNIVVLADETTNFPAGITWDNGGSPVIVSGSRLLVQLIWSGSDWVGTYGIPFSGGSISPAEPTFTDMSGTNNDRYSIPYQVGVNYLKNNVVLAAGDYTPSAGENVTITAEAQANYVLIGTTSWSHQFSTETSNTAPTITLGANSVVGNIVTQAFTTYDLDGNTVSVTANWDDGTTPSVVTSPAEHTYASNGVYQASFTPSDGIISGAPGYATYTITSIGVPPVGSPTTFEGAITSYGALGYWKLNETTGTTIVDYSGNDNDLTLTGTAGTDYSLATKDGYIRFLTASGYAGDLGGSKFSISQASGYITVITMFHLLNTSGGTARRLVTKHSGTQAEWGFILNARNYNSNIYRANPTILLSYSNATSVQVPANQWVLGATVLPYDYAIRPKIWSDSGTPLSANSGSTGVGSIGDGSALFRIGAGHIGGMAHTAVFPFELSDAHIQKLADLARSEGFIP